MNISISRVALALGLMSASVVALAGEPKPTPPQEPAGFIVGGVIGAFAAGPVGAVIGAGIGTWLGNRVQRAGEAAKAESQMAALQTEKSELQTEKGVLITQKSDLAETNRALTARLDEVSHTAEAARNLNPDPAVDGAARVLNGVQGDVLFRTGSADIDPQMAHGIDVLAQAVAKSPDLKVRVDGYADPRGETEANLKLSQARADAVRDVFLAAGVAQDALEINAYGDSRSIAEDEDGYALERRVRMTLQVADPAAVAQIGAASANE